MINKIRYWIWNKVLGYPSDVKNLLDYIDTFDGDICIYPGGEFKFGMKFSDESIQDDLIFPTPQERAAFAAGLNQGIQIMGGETAFLNNEQLQEYEDMEKLSSTLGDPKKVH